MSSTRIIKPLLPFDVDLKLAYFQSRRLRQNEKRRRETASTSRNKIYDVDRDTLQTIIQKYLKDSLERELSDSKVQYVLPLEVYLRPIDRRRLRGAGDENRAELDVIFNITAELNEIDYVQNRRMVITRSHYESSFSGSVIFEQEDVERFTIPRDNTVQSIQLEALSDEEGVLLGALQNSNPETGLDAVTSISASSATSGTPQQPPVTGPNVQEGQGVDAIIIIAIAVAAGSMMLLGFALLLAFRRRQKQRAEGHSKMMESPGYKTSGKTESDNSPLSRQLVASPPVAEMQLELDQDDNVSEYTESVFSLPPETKKIGVSSRFNPRYIVSNERNNGEEVSADSSEDEIIPPPPVVRDNCEENKSETETDPLNEKFEPVFFIRIVP